MRIRFTQYSCLLLLAACASGTGSKDDDAIVITASDQDGDTIIDLHEGYVDPLAPDAEEEGTEDTDTDLPEDTDTDTDSGEDTDSDEPEVSMDTDGDGTPDYLDLDSDGDGISDAKEAGDSDPITLPWDSDTDGLPNFRDTDSDDNCISDTDEGEGDFDEDGIPDFADMDDDNDTILDRLEITEGCDITDTDGDGTPDFRDIDSDGDGIGDYYEAGISNWGEEPADDDKDGVPNHLDLDSDNDGLSDASEGGVTDPTEEPRDTDGDGIYDFRDIDSDGDGLTDQSEHEQLGTDPYDSDSDGDGYTDGAEVSAGTNPADAGSVIEGIYVTVPERTSVEKDFDFELIVQMGDVAFLIDTTGSMYSTVSGMASEFSSIVSSVSSVLPKAEYGVATYDDYAYSPYGSPGTDKPFELLHQVSSDISSIQSTLSSIPLHYGSDGPESGMEALYQSLTGAGYDQNCNGSYDSIQDVKPFIADSTDPFGGSGGQFQTTGTFSGGGDLGGYGFRPYALPVVVYATDNYLRDPDSSNYSYNGTPGGCPIDAGFNDVVSAASDLNAFLIGIAANYSTAMPQMQDLGDATSSYADTDGDGAADDELVFLWTGSSSKLRSTITNAIRDLVESIRFSKVTLEIEGDEHGFITDVDPSSYTISAGASGQTIDFTLSFRGAVAATEEDQVFLVTLNVVGDDAILLDTLDIWIVVPGGSY